MSRGYHLPDRMDCHMFVMQLPQDCTAECVCRYVAPDGRRFNSTSGRWSETRLRLMSKAGSVLHTGVQMFLERQALQALNLAIQAHNAVVEPYPND